MPKLICGWKGSSLRRTLWVAAPQATGTRARQCLIRQTRQTKTSYGSGNFVLVTRFAEISDLPTSAVSVSVAPSTRGPLETVTDARQNDNAPLPHL